MLRYNAFKNNFFPFVFFPDMMVYKKGLTWSSWILNSYLDSQLIHQWCIWVFHHKLVQFLEVINLRLTSNFSTQLGTSSGMYAPLVERVDTKDDHVIVYLKEVREQQHSYTFVISDFWEVGQNSVQYKKQTCTQTNETTFLYLICTNLLT